MVLSRLGAAALVASIVGLSASSMAVEVVGNEVTLGWSPASGAVSGYYVIVSRDASAPKVESVTIAAQKSLAGATGETLVVQVAAFSQDGVAGPISAPSDPVTFVQSSGSGGGSTPPPDGGGGTTPPPPGSGGGSGEPVLPLAHDFNGDGASDLLVRSASTVRLWVMQGAHVASDIALPAAPSGSGVVGTGDYDGNQNADLLWENAATGALTLWRLAGGQVIGTSNLDRSSLPATEEWHVGGSGDVDGDGSDELMLWSRVKGEVELWTFEAGAVAARSRLSGHTGAWSVVAVDDVDGDGRAEIVWMDELHRVMELRDPAAAQPVALGGLASGWRGLGGADLDGDGSAELVMRNAGVGATEAWALGDAGVLGSNELPTSQNLGVFAGGGDFDADGREDVVWSDASDGAVTLWLGSAGGIAPVTVDRALPAGGQIISGASASDDAAFRNRFCSGDLDGSGYVNASDFKVFRRCLDKPRTAACDLADMNSDGWVSKADDLEIFKLRFTGQRCETW
jgi:VCBS repeat protein/dockerin type I repeat protein